MRLEFTVAIQVQAIQHLQPSPGFSAVLQVSLLRLLDKFHSRGKIPISPWTLRFQRRQCTI